jgi:hypothetical protein
VLDAIQSFRTVLNRPLLGRETVRRGGLNSNKGTKSDIEMAPAERSLGQIQFVLF